jgi:hypothetical protein
MLWYSEFLIFLFHVYTAEGKTPIGIDLPMAILKKVWAWRHDSQHNDT